MRALRAVREPKTVITIGAWHEGKMPATAFPLSKGRSYTLGASWRWCICELEGNGASYRLLVAFHYMKAQYQAWLGYRDGADQALIGRLEYHPTHRGWHVHVKCGPLADVSRGVVKQPGCHENWRQCATETKPFVVSELDGLSIAFRLFGVSAGPSAFGLSS